MKRIIYLLITVALTIACTKTPPIEPPIDWSRKVLVLNQGNFSEHSSSISLYDEDSGEVQNGLFEAVNDISIGATLVSGRVSPFKNIYLVCNYPDKIEVIGSRDFKLIGEPITQELANPRDIAIGENRIYVSNWDYSYEENSEGWWYYPNSYIAIYEKESREFIKKVEVGTDAEGLLLGVGNTLFVATAEGVKVLDTEEDLLTTKAIIAPEGWGGAKHIVQDKFGWMWASFPAKGVVKFSGTTNQADRVVEVPIDTMNGVIESSAVDGSLYTYNTTFDSNYQPEQSTIYRISEGGESVSIFATGNYFYGVGVSPVTNNVLAAEVSFTSNSLIKRYSSNGTLRPFTEENGGSREGAAVGVGAFRFLFF